MNHFTSRTGYDGIRSQIVWKFLASQPPGRHPRGAYFTTLGPEEKKLAQRLRIPREKVAYYFSFAGDDGLLPIEGGRGKYVFYSPDDYSVPPVRQTGHGPREEPA
jgi:hypothetical protein